MVSLICSIVFWCTKNRPLGVVSIVLSALGMLVDFPLVGFWIILDLIILLVNIAVYSKTSPKD